MWTAKWILDDYEAGDEAIRLEMYMAYPDLRRYFEEFEARLEASVGEKAILAIEKPTGVWGNHCCRLAKGFGA